MRLHTLHELDETEGTVQLRQRATPHKFPKVDRNLAKSITATGAVDLPGGSTLILVPRPSNTDPNDPLRWPQFKKHICFFAVCSFTFLTNFGVAGLAPAFALLSKEFDKSVTETSDLLLWPVLVLGLFNFFWVPLAHYFGKRPILVFASLLLCVAYIWGAFAKSFKSLLWSSIVASFAGSTTEALGAAMVNDLYFLHERGSKMGIYIISISGGNTIGPLICGFVVETIGWRWFKGTAAIAVGINFVLVLLFVPETRYDRTNPQPLSHHSFDAAISPSSPDDSHQGKTPRSRKTSFPNPSPSPRPQLQQKTYLQQLSLWSGTPPNTNFLTIFLRPFPLILYPAVIYAFLGYATSLAWVVAINILSSFVLSAPPYAFPPSLIGLINIPGLLGNLLGAFTGGWLVDWFADWRTAKSGGVFRPESRLPVLVVPAVIVPAGCVLWGYGLRDGLSWVALFFAYGMVAVGLTAVPAATMVYVSDSYFPVAMDALLLINGLKNIVAFGFLYGILPWVDTVGYVDCFGTQAGVYVAIVVLLGLPLWWFGEKIRHVTAQWRIIL